MKSKYHIKLICGFRKDQHFSVNANEAHKAYYLFNNPDKRGTFSDGLSVRGSDIQMITPDYQTSAGWNATHTLDSDDMNYLHGNGILGKLKMIMGAAKEVARIGNDTDLGIPLIELMTGKYQTLELRKGSKFAQQVLAQR